ncbi:MAG: hypothetical protein LBD69_01015 [Puniceicoccales bacterium]|nr:hypothetical protein [Puniceicoccales bacterium]
MNRVAWLVVISFAVTFVLPAEKRTIRIAFADFCADISGPSDIQGQKFVAMLKKYYNVEIGPNADFLFYSCWGDAFRQYKNCVKIFYTGENVVPNFNECDYAITCHPIHFGSRHFQYNSDVLSFKSCERMRLQVDQKCLHRKFCNFVYCNASKGDGAILRQDFAKKLMHYKRVDCPGRVLNNMQQAIVPRGGGNAWESKVDFIKDYKFTIAFENASSEGYVTEKLVHPFMANSIPIYWGNPSVGTLLNTKAFINCHEYDDLDAVIRKVIELDQDDAKYLAMFREPITKEKTVLNNEKNLEQFLVAVIEKGNVPFYKSQLYLPKKNLFTRISYFNYCRYWILSKMLLGAKGRHYRNKFAEIKLQLRCLGNGVKVF